MQNLRTKLLMKNANEAVTVGKLIEPILRMAGFDTEDINSVEEEYEIKTSSGSIFVDRVLKDKFGKPSCAVQAKKIGDTYSLKNDIAKTIYPTIALGIEYAVFTDGIEWRLFRSSKHLRTVNLLDDNTKSNEKYLVDFLKSI